MNIKTLQNLIKFWAWWNCIPTSWVGSFFESAVVTSKGTEVKFGLPWGTFTFLVKNVVQVVPPRDFVTKWNEAWKPVSYDPAPKRK